MSDYCVVSKPIYASSLDTAGTKRQILEHNRKYEEICGD